MAYSDDASTQAIQAGADVHNVYDSRAATYEKLGKLKDALKDSGQVIKIAPTLVQVSGAPKHPRSKPMSCYRAICVPLVS